MDELEVFQDWIENISKPRQSLGCFFIFGETVQPYFWNSSYSPKIPLEDAWKVICGEWLNPIYKCDLQPLFPYILKGVVEPGKVILGNDCPFYFDDIKFNFNLKEVDYCLDSSLAVSLNLPLELARLLYKVNKECPYFEKLPAKIQFRKRDYGMTPERDAAGEKVVQKAIAKVKRFGEFPKMEKA